jgi:hypothetical protein
VFAEQFLQVGSPCYWRRKQSAPSRSQGKLIDTKYHPGLRLIGLFGKEVPAFYDLSPDPNGLSDRRIYLHLSPQVPN